MVTAFKAMYPKVHLALHQSSPQQIAQMVATGEADIGISTEALDKHAELRTFPAYTWSHCVLVQKGHPLEQVQPLTLQALAEYPIVTYDAAFAGRSHIDAAFGAAKLNPDVVLTAIDADVIKTFVEAGLGVGIVADMAFDPVRDTHLTRIDSTHLFEHNTSKVAVRRGAYLREFAIQFVSLVARDLSPDLIRTALSRQEDGDTYGRGSE
ncbi:MAG: hypothetical protein HGA47_10465 [Zoogloea sp.]|nr:hypothetical protein [Zoogloea sp.]